MTNHDPSEQNEDGFTIAMILAKQNKHIPKNLYHDPSIRNKYGFTVALYQAQNGIIPDECW